jgi:hypothetical protein
MIFWAKKNCFSGYNVINAPPGGTCPCRNFAYYSDRYRRPVTFRAAFSGSLTDIRANPLFGKLKICAVLHH